jgi:hypothetical protein
MNRRDIKKKVFCMIFECEKHGLVPPVRVCSHLHEILSINENEKGRENMCGFHVVKCYLKTTFFEKGEYGEVFVCSHCASLLAFEVNVTYDYQLFSEEKKRLFHSLMNFFCCECVDEWIAREFGDQWQQPTTSVGNVNK